MIYNKHKLIFQEFKNIIEKITFFSKIRQVFIQMCEIENFDKFKTGMIFFFSHLKKNSKYNKKKIKNIFNLDGFPGVLVYI